MTALLSLAGCSDSSPEKRSKDAPPPAVRVAEVEMTPLQAAVTASGLLVPREEAAVGSELAGYRVLRVLVDEGDFVRAGQPLAILDGALLRGQVAQAQAERLRASITAERAQSEARRVAGLDGTGVIAEETIAQRRFEARAAQAQLAAASAQLADLRQREGRLTLRAPTSGIVLQRVIRPGDVAGGSVEPYFRIARGSLIELEAEVPEAELGRVTEGQPATVLLATGQKIAGTVRLVGARVDPQTKLVRVRVALPVDPSLKAGGFARAELSGGGKSVATVPERAIQYSADGPFVSIVDRTNRVRRIAIRTGARASGRVELRSGPAAGTRVLLGGGALVLPGDLVRPLSAKAR
ncbi:efflux RND transporter periplasmic adaptor subunit [Nostoc sp. CHAB 5824]|nr:efflux RND transporter periplasmic adaptor subunit [Nostoc sp. CHAB 5824]